MNLLLSLLRRCFKTAALAELMPQIPDVELPLNRVGIAVVTISNERMSIDSLLAAGRISQVAWEWFIRRARVSGLYCPIK